MECLINLEQSFPQDFSEPNTSATFKRELHIHSIGKKKFVAIRLHGLPIYILCFLVIRDSSQLSRLEKIPW